MRRTNARNTSSSAQQPRQQISERLSNSHAGQASTLKRPSQDVSNTLNQQLTQQIQPNVPQLLLPTTEDQLSDTEIASLSEVSEIAETVFDILPNPPADDQEQLSSEESGRDQRGFGYSTVCKSSISTKKKKMKLTIIQAKRPYLDLSDDQEPSGCRRRRKVIDLNIFETLWSNAQDIFWCKIQTQNPFPVDVDSVARASFDMATKYVRESMNEVRPGRNEIHTVNPSFQLIGIVILTYV